LSIGDCGFLKRRLTIVDFIGTRSLQLTNRQSKINNQQIHNRQ